MEDFLLTVHSFLRFVILVVGVAGVLRSLVSLGTREAKFARVEEVFSRAYSGALDLQTLAGAALVVLLSGQSREVQWIHPIFMLPAVVVSHLGRRFTERSNRDRHKAQIGIYLGSLALILLGLAVIRQLRLI